MRGEQRRTHNREHARVPRDVWILVVSSSSALDGREATDSEPSDCSELSDCGHLAPEARPGRLLIAVSDILVGFQGTHTASTSVADRSFAPLRWTLHLL